MLRKTFSKITNLFRAIRPETLASENIMSDKASKGDQKPKGKRPWVYEKRKKKGEPREKKPKTDIPPPTQMEGRPDRKRKVALLLAYCGKGYYGIQKNPGFPTIESELVKALCKVEAIPEDHAENFFKMSFQRAARTDKGVSAAAQVVSLKMLLNAENLLEKINENLPSQIRVLSYKRTTNGFDSKNFCSSRTYIYIIPTFAFAPFDSTETEDYRVTDTVLARVNEVLTLFHGTHNFHNYTSGVKPTEARAKRYIMAFACGKPFVKDDMEFVRLTVKGQSFMMHHIRKMIGITIAIVKGLCGEDVIQKSWEPLKVDIPKAPGLGLLLFTTHYDGYNKRYGNDGLHEAIEWSDVQDKIELFQNEVIFPHIIKSEKEEKSMLNWLGTLTCHDFDVREDGVNEIRWGYMTRKLKKMDKEARETSSGSNSPTHIQQSTEEAPSKNNREIIDQNEPPLPGQIQESTEEAPSKNTELPTISPGDTLISEEVVDVKQTSVLEPQLDILENKEGLDITNPQPQDKLQSIEKDISESKS